MCLFTPSTRRGYPQGPTTGRKGTMWGQPGPDSLHSPHLHRAGPHASCSGSAMKLGVLLCAERPLANNDQWPLVAMAGTDPCAACQRRVSQACARWLPACHGHWLNSVGAVSTAPQAQGRRVGRRCE